MGRIWNDPSFWLVESILSHISWGINIHVYVCRVKCIALSTNKEMVVILCWISPVNFHNDSSIFQSSLISGIDFASRHLQYSTNVIYFEEMIVHSTKCTFPLCDACCFSQSLLTLTLTTQTNHYHYSIEIGRGNRHKFFHAHIPKAQTN